LRQCGAEEEDLPSGHPAGESRLLLQLKTLRTVLMRRYADQLILSTYNIGI